MRHLKVSTRLLLSFGLILALMLVMSGIGAWQIMQAQKQGEFLQTRQETTALIMQWGRQVDLNAAQTQALIHTSEGLYRSQLEADVQASAGRITETQDALGKLLFLAEGRAIYDEILARRKTYTDVRDRILQAQVAGDFVQAQLTYDTEMPPATAAYLGQIDHFIRFQNNYVQDLFVQNQHNARIGLMTLAIATVLALILGPLFAGLMGRSLLRQLGGEPAHASDIAQEIAAGNLSVAIPLRPNDRTSLMASMESMRANLARMVGEIRNGAAAIASASAQITTGNLDLSSRTEQQASSLAETAATMEEITATVRQNTDSARQANTLADAAAKTATDGGGLVSELITTMGDINQQSQQVADIIGVIDGIAFQTNILALNAAVEAARAGEQGRGFAVVAAEVRALAQRSATSAREIKTLIETSVLAAGKGNEQAARAGTTMQEIVTSIHRVTDIMSEITAASQEQTAGIEQINTAVTEMDDVTRQNASLVEESAAAAASLQTQANALDGMIAAFRLNGADTSVAAPQSQIRMAPPTPAVAAPATPARLTGNGKAGHREWLEF